MTIINESQLFSKENIAIIEKNYDATYVCDTEHKDFPVTVFYGAEAHPVSGSRYFAMYFTRVGNILTITNGAFIEDQDIAAVIADNGDIIYSRSRHDYRVSADGSVFIDGGRAYTRSGMYGPDRKASLHVRDGVLQLKESNESN